MAILRAFNPYNVSVQSGDKFYTIDLNGNVRELRVKDTFLLEALRLEASFHFLDKAKTLTPAQLFFWQNIKAKNAKSNSMRQASLQT